MKWAILVLSVIVVLLVLRQPDKHHPPVPQRYSFQVIHGKFFVFDTATADIYFFGDDGHWGKSGRNPVQDAENVRETQMLQEFLKQMSETNAP
jgi:hypothetical protein